MADPHNDTGNVGQAIQGSAAQTRLKPEGQNIFVEHEMHVGGYVS